MRGRHSFGLRRIGARASVFVCLLAVVQLIARVGLALAQEEPAAAPEQGPLWTYIAPALILVGLLIGLLLVFKEYIINYGQSTNSALIPAVANLPWGKLFGLYSLIYFPCLVVAWKLHWLDMNHPVHSILNVAAVPIIVLLVVYFLNMLRPRKK